MFSQPESPVPKKEIMLGADGVEIRRSKIEYCKLNSRPFRVAFSGINQSRQLAMCGTFSIFISQILHLPVVTQGKQM